MSDGSATLQFYRRNAEYCSCVQCARVVVRLEVDFGSLLPEIEAEGRLVIRCEAPLDHWLSEGVVSWQPTGFWADLRPALWMAANDIVGAWIGAARGHVLEMTGLEILAALDGGQSIVVARAAEST